MRAICNTYIAHTSSQYLEYPPRLNQRRPTRSLALKNSKEVGPKTLVMGVAVADFSP